MLLDHCCRVNLGTPQNGDPGSLLSRDNGDPGPYITNILGTPVPQNHYD